MIGRKKPIDKFQLEMLCLNNLVPEEHLVRKLKKEIKQSTTDPDCGVFHNKWLLDFSKIK